MPSPTTERSVVDVLRAAKDRISDPERWTTGEAARDAFDNYVEATDASARKWCALGACEVEGPEVFYQAEGFLATVAKASGLNRGVAMVNDGEGHAATLALFDAAIELAEAEQK